jgi:hypothetical protein
MKFTVRETLGMPSVGLRLAVITAVSEETANNVDKTPQAKLVFKSSIEGENWMISKWYPLRGYKKDPITKKDIIGKNGLRTEDEVSTASCLEMLGKDAFRAGLDPEKEVDLTDLVGCKVGLVIEPKPNDPTKVEVSKVYSHDYALDLV